MKLLLLSVQPSCERHHRNLQSRMGDGIDLGLFQVSASKYNRSKQALFTERNVWSEYNHADSGVTVYSAGVRIDLSGG